MIIKFAILYFIFLTGCWFGKCTGMKKGYRNCHRDLLIAKLEGRTHIGSTFDKFLEENDIHIDKKEIQNRLNTLYDGEYEW